MTDEARMAVRDADLRNLVHAQGVGPAPLYRALAELQRRRDVEAAESGTGRRAPAWLGRF